MHIPLHYRYDLSIIKWMFLKRNLLSRLAEISTSSSAHGFQGQEQFRGNLAGFLVHDFPDLRCHCLQGKGFLDIIDTHIENTLMGNDIRGIARHEQAA